MQTVIKYSAEMRIRNLESLARGVGAKYLEVIRGEGRDYVAKRWRRKLPKTAGIFICLKD